MTVITMPAAEKKADNVPLVGNMEVDPAAAQAKDLEAGNVGSDQPVRSKYLVLRVINERVYSMWALVYVLLMSLAIIFMIFYGAHIYRAVGNAFNDESDAFYGTGTISLSDKLTDPLEDLSDDYDGSLSEMEFKKLENFAMNMDKINSQMMNQDKGITEFKEDFEMDLKDDNYEKIMPALPLGSSARFIHDFSTNITGIVDEEGKRCFVMPLNRSSVLPPYSLFDLLFKMSSGYYAVDTSTVMHNMRVVKPAVEDLSEYGVYIAQDCKNYPTFKLEKIVSGVFKRSVPQGKIFSAFAGKMDSFNVVNYHEIDSP